MIDAQRRLVTKEGLPVLRAEGVPGEDPAARQIVIQGNQVSVGDAGNITVDGQPLGNLSVVRVNDNDSLRKVGNSRYALKDIYQQVPERSPSIRVHQGFLENSNVNIIREMTDMIATTRVFESTQKAIQAYDTMNSKVVNDIPKF